MHQLQVSISVSLPVVPDAYKFLLVCFATYVGYLGEHPLELRNCRDLWKVSLDWETDGVYPVVTFYREGRVC